MYIKFKQGFDLLKTKGGQVIDTSKLVIKETIPRQLPKDVDEKSLVENAQTASQVLKSMVFVQLGLAPILKGGEEDLLSSFYCI